MANSAFTHEPSFTIPGSTTDNAVIRWDGTSGAGQQNSGILIDDSNVLSGITSLTVDNLNLNGNTVISTDTNGNITFAPNGSGSVVADTVGNSEMSFNGTVLDLKNNGTQSSIKLYCETGNAHYQEIRGGPHSGATSYTMVLPHEPPTANQVLTTASISSNVAVLDWADAAGGGVDTTGTPANNQIATFTDSDTIQGESELTYVGGSLTLTNASGAALLYLKASTGQALTKLVGASNAAKWDVGIDGDGSSNQKSHVDDWCMYSGGTYGVVISGDGSNKFGIGTQAGIATDGAEIPATGFAFGSGAKATTNPGFIGVRVENSSTQSFNHNSAGTISFDASVTQFDTDTMHSSSASTKITFTTAGKYWVGLTYAWSAHATGKRNIWVSKNNSATIARQTDNPSIGEEMHGVFGFIYEFAAADYIYFYGHQTSGGALNLMADNESATVAMAYRIG